MSSDDADSRASLKRLGVMAGIGLVVGIVAVRMTYRPPGYDEICAKPLRNVEEIEQAQVDGYEINRTYRCITRASFEEIERHKQLRERR